MKRNDGSGQCNVNHRMVMAGITSKIPPDEVIDAMRAIGRKDERDIRETKRRACRTLTGVAIRERMAGTL